MSLKQVYFHTFTKDTKNADIGILQGMTVNIFLLANEILVCADSRVKNGMRRMIP